jgi:two-component system OmpR family response regulator
VEPGEPPKARLMLVEDDADLHELFAKVARREGYEVVSAYNGEDALSILRECARCIDWLLTDIRLPGLVDGWIVGSEFNLSYARRPVIYVSGVEEDSRRRTATSIFLKKPVMINDLIATFRRMETAAAAR